ncbi:PTS trehalose transporter subunit IIBC [Lactiplantibacillus plantarum EGD-AQ4]|nr:PTS trehalose transporter subunit IIBC [Lactiplantibacillus plantarum EGD-AQ4]
MNRLLAFTAHVNRGHLATISRRTFRMMFPIMLLGSIAEVIKYAFLTRNGYMDSLFRITTWLPYSASLAGMLEIIFHCTIGMIALYGAYGMAHFTVKESGHQNASAGIIAVLAFLLICYRPTKTQSLAFDATLLAQGLLIAMITGYLVGRLILKFDRQNNRQPNPLVIPILVVLIGATLINRGLNLINQWQLPTTFVSLMSVHAQTSSISVVIGLGALTEILAWLAIGGPFINAPTFTDAPSWANMNAALRHQSAWQVPYQFTDTTLFHSFANFGGSGVMLALVIAILLFSKNANHRSVSKWSLFPTLFNSHHAMMLGIPILFNPIFLIPFVLAPIVNMLIAAGFIALKWIPVATYPVPSGTPGPLIAFIGTNGKWLTLILGLLLLALDVMIYIPFVKATDWLDADRVGRANETEN